MLALVVVYCASPSAARRLLPRRWSPSPSCQAEADAFCATSCFAKIKDRPCGGPQLARKGQGLGAQQLGVLLSRGTDARPPELLAPRHQGAVFL